MGEAVSVNEKAEPCRKHLPMLKAVKRVEEWKKVLAMLEEVKVDPKKLEEAEEVLIGITSNIEMSIEREESPDPSPLYEQQALAIRLLRALEDLREGAEVQRQLEKKLQSVCKGG